MHFSCELLSCLNSTPSHHSSTIAVHGHCQSLLYHHQPQSNCSIFSSFCVISANKCIFSHSVNLNYSKLIIPPVLSFYHSTSLLSFHACRHFCCFSSSFHPFQCLSNSSLSPSFSKLPYAHFFLPHLRKLRFRRHCHFLFFLLLLLSGDIELNPGPIVTSSSLSLAHLNTRSVSSVTESQNKPTLLHDFISDNSIDILSLTETWLPPDTLQSIYNSITPPNYFLLYQSHPEGRGGGIALLYRSYLKITKMPLPLFSSFEALCVRLTISSFSYTILTVYRSPSLSKSVFYFCLNSLLFLKTSSHLLLNF